MWAQLFLTWTPPITTDTRSPSLSLSHTGHPFWLGLELCDSIAL
jgi:hypothetical protein